MPLPYGLARTLALATSLFLVALPAQSQTEQQPPTAEALAEEIRALKQEYETRIQSLETQLQAINAQPAAAPRSSSQSNTFNPAIGVVLNAAFSNFSTDHSEISGFQPGHESERGQEGLALLGTELNFSANVDDKFFGSTTIGIHTDADGHEAFEVEEAYIQTLPGAGLPSGLRAKAGRALWTFGYLNEHHPHADDFVDRPLPYRVFIDQSYNDNGAELSYVLPTDMFIEAGAGLFRGDDFPFGGSDTGRTVTSAYARIGNDLGANHSFRAGAYVLNGSAMGRDTAHAHGGDEGHGEDDAHGDDDDHDNDDHAHDGHDHFAGAFTGDVVLYGLDVRYTWAPTGNPRDQELTLQGEYFWRDEDGKYVQETLDEETKKEVHEETIVDGTSSGWYVQGTYKFNPAWRVGIRYSELTPMKASDVQSEDEYEPEHDPSTISVMGDWTNSEFGRIRLQFNRESLNPDETDNQVYLQYIMSLGAHAAHAY